MTHILIILAIWLLAVFAFFLLSPVMAMSILQITSEFLIVAFIAYCGWLVFLLFARLFTLGNPFEKSEDMEADANTDWYHETRNNPMPLGNPHKLPHGSREQAEAVRALNEHSKRQKAIDEKARQKSRAADAEKDKETVRSFGCGCVLLPVVLSVLVFGIWFSSKYPGWDDLMILLGR